MHTPSTNTEQRPVTRMAAARAHAALGVLTLLTIATHGYHPYAEDGGLYVAGVEWLLQPSLFPHDRAFVTAHLRYSIFAPLLAGIVRQGHVALPWLLAACYLMTTWLFLYSIYRLALVFVEDARCALVASTLAAAWFALPIAGTSLLMMDPYVTARSFSTPLSLLALALLSEAVQSDHLRSAAVQRAVAAVVLLALAAAFHPLMAGYAVILCVLVCVFRYARGRALTATLSVFLLGAAVLSFALQLHSPGETSAQLAAVLSRNYWFLSRWQWYELAGLVAPPVLLAAPLCFRRLYLSPAARAFLLAAITLCGVAALLCLLFARERLVAHEVARLQPLRVLLQAYALMTGLIGSYAARYAFASGRNSRTRKMILLTALLAMFAIFFFVSRATYPASAQIELPWAASRNPWAQAFFWIRSHTAPSALVSLDAKYVNTEGEDAQNFRAIALRSELPDFSKDGGEAAITPSLATQWLIGATVQRGLSELTDPERDRRLLPLGVDWVVLHSSAETHHVCPYNNGTVKVCSLR